MRQDKYVAFSMLILRHQMKLLLLFVSLCFLCTIYLILRLTLGISLVVQWLKICLPMQGTEVRSLAREDPTCRGAIKPVRHNY